MYAAYSQAGQALDYALLGHISTVVNFGEIQQVNPVYSLSDKLREECIECLVEKNYAGISSIIEQEMLLLRKSGNCVQLLHSFTMELSLLISRFLRSYLPGYTGNDVMAVIQQIVART